MREHEEIKLIDISAIRIVNPRSRSKSIHNELVESIKNIGLEPIPVGNRILVLTSVLVIARALDYMTLSIKTYCPEF